MVLQRSLEYGFKGYRVPPTPRAPRSARKRASSRKKNEDHNRMCAFDLLAIVANKLLQDDERSSEKFIREETRTINEPMITPVMDTSSGITVSECSQKFPSAPRSVNGENRILGVPSENASCKIENVKNKLTKNEEPNNGKPLIVKNLDRKINLAVRDDDENSCGSIRIGDRRIWRLSASKQWKVAPKLNDDAELKTVYRSKKTCINHQRSLTDYPFKKQRLYQSENPSDSNGISGLPRNGSIEDGSGLDAEAMVSSRFASKDQDSVKLKIKSFRVPEFFIEIPETATVSSLKRTVMEAVTTIFSGEINVGVMLDGERIRDDNVTLLQTGICHDDKLDALGFTLEPDQLKVPPFLCHEDQSVVPPSDMPEPLTRCSPPLTVANRVGTQDELSGKLPDSPMKKIMELDHDSIDHRVTSDSRALVTVPAMDGGALAVVPAMRKSEQAEVPQRRVRRPFSVSEVEALVEAVEQLGTGRWRDVKLRAFEDAKHRTYVDLKDKWKTLVHTARISPQQRRGEPVPQALLDRVLMAHGYWTHHQAKHQPQTEICRLL